MQNLDGTTYINIHTQVVKKTKKEMREGLNQQMSGRLAKGANMNRVQ